MNLKLYTQDLGWAGSIVVVSDSEINARKLMEDLPNYDVTEPVKEHEIKSGFIHVNLGDM